MNNLDIYEIVWIIYNYLYLCFCMEKWMKKIGWEEIYPDTLKRLDSFKHAFMAIFPDIAEPEVDKLVVYTFGTYGQGHVYDIFMAAVQGDPIDKQFKDFVDAFKNTLPAEIIAPITGQHYFTFFIDYLFSKFIKL